MDLPPSIPTSFVPPPASAASRRFGTDYTGAFGFFAYGVLGVVFLLAIGVFFYGKVLGVSQAAKDKALTQAQQAIDPKVAEDFVRLRDRLSQGKRLLDGHVALSNFLALFNKEVPVTVRFTSLTLSFDEKGNVAIVGSGVAKNFNALAFTSTTFASEGNLKDAIFSGIGISSKDSSVSFTLNATADPKVIAFSP